VLVAQNEIIVKKYVKFLVRIKFAFFYFSQNGFD